MQEEFKDVKGYEGLYQVSNLGNVKSLSREISNNRGYYFNTEKILKFGKSREYLNVTLYKNSARKMFKVHTLVTMAFLGHKSDVKGKIVVDHINNNPLDNRLENLQIITQRENASKDKKNKTSKYTGVCWHKSTQKWRAKICINGKSIWLGVYETEEEAYLVYLNAKNNIKD